MNYPTPIVLQVDKTLVNNVKKIELSKQNSLLLSNDHKNKVLFIVVYATKNIVS